VLSTLIAYIPVLLLRSCFFLNQRRHVIAPTAAAGEGTGGADVEASADNVKSCCDNVKACSDNVEACLAKMIRRLPRWFGVVPWSVALLCTFVAAAVTILATSANEDTTTLSSKKTALLPCHCRISHNTNQTTAWLLLIALQLIIWFCVSLPLSIVFFACYSEIRHPRLQRRRKGRGRKTGNLQLTSRDDFDGSRGFRGLSASARLSLDSSSAGTIAMVRLEGAGSRHSADIDSMGKIDGRGVSAGTAGRDSGGDEVPMQMHDNPMSFLRLSSRHTEGKTSVAQTAAAATATAVASAAESSSSTAGRKLVHHVSSGISQQEDRLEAGEEEEEKEEN